MPRARSRERTYFTTHTVPDEQGRVRFTMEWYSPYHHSGIYWRAQEFFGNLQEHVNTAKAAGQKVTVKRCP